MMEDMRIVGVPAPGAGASVDLHVGHGEDPRMLVWQEGYVISQLLSARLDNDEVVVTAQILARQATNRPPRVRSRGIDPRLELRPGEIPVERQRIAAYAIVRSSLGLLGTQCSAATAIPGMWQLPGGGLEAGELPSDAVIREIREETAQEVQIDRLIDIQSDHWIGRAPNGVLEDFQALRIIYTATCASPTEPEVLDVGGTTQSASWVPLRRWRRLPWTSGARSLLDRHLDSVPLD